MEIKEKAVDYIGDLIQNLGTRVSKEIVVEATKYIPFQYLFRVALEDESITVEFDRALIDDLEIALEKYQKTSYFNTLVSNVKFQVLIELGVRGFLGNFPISDEIINDKRDWIKNYQVETHFSPEMTELLYEGLLQLTKFFESQIKKHERLKIPYPEIKENKEWAESLIGYYNQHKHLNSSGVGIRNLQFLKAAVIIQIMDFEKLRENERAPTTWKALNNKIYDIVIELRKDPFLEIQPPEFINDIVAEA